MTPTKRPAQRLHRTHPTRPKAKGLDHDGADPTVPKRALPRHVTDGPDTTPLWIFAAALGLSMATVLAGVQGGWLLFVLTLATGYAWLPTKDAPQMVRRRPAPTRVSPRMQRFLTEGAGPWILATALGGTMIAVGWLSGL